MWECCANKRGLVKRPCLIRQSLSLVFNPSELKTYVHPKTCAQIGNHEIANIWKQQRCPSIREWIGNKIWYIHTVGYCSAIKRNELSSHVKAGRNLKCILLSARSQSKEGTYYTIPTIWHSGKGKTRETVKRPVVARGLEGRKDEYV